MPSIKTVVSLLSLTTLASQSLAAPPPIPTTTAKPLLTNSTHAFGPFIEGATFYQNSLLAVDYISSSQHLRNCIGAIDIATGTIKPFLATPEGTELNGIRIVDNGQKLLVGDPTMKSLYVYQLQNNQPTSEPTANITIPTSFGVPNDLTSLDEPGTGVFVFGGQWKPNGTNTDGEIWYIPITNGTPTKLLTVGRTNGIALSNDKKALFFTENVAQTNNIYSAKIVYTNNTVQLSQPKLITTLSPATPNVTPDSDLDGLRIHPKTGNIFVVHTGNGKSVFDVKPENGKIQRVISVSMNNPTNLDFDAEGTKVFVVGRCGDAPFGSGFGCVDVAEL